MGMGLVGEGGKRGRAAGGVGVEEKGLGKKDAKERYVCDASSRLGNLDPGLTRLLSFAFCSLDLLATLATKRTPVFDVHFTPRNLVLACGPMQDA